MSKPVQARKHPMEYYAPPYPDIAPSVRELKKGNIAVVEPIICYLERDVYALGSGYSKENIWRFLLRVKLSKKEKERLRHVALHYIETRLSREFFPMCRFIRGIADDGFTAQVCALQISSDQKSRRRAMIMAAYLKSIKEGEAARRNLF